MSTSALSSDHIGFTGTQIGPTPEQVVGLRFVLGHFDNFIGHHGVCIGADVTFDEVARSMSGFQYMHLYPMRDAGTKAGKIVQGPKDIVHNPQPPLVRNEQIAEACDFLVAIPKEDHMMLRSGTWTTVRYAMKKRQPLLDGAKHRDKRNKPVFVIIPTGQVIHWNP